jgi:hypothetical protein
MKKLNKKIEAYRWISYVWISYVLIKSFRGNPAFFVSRAKNTIFGD